jgi:hypothetical protein
VGGEEVQFFGRTVVKPTCDWCLAFDEVVGVGLEPRDNCFGSWILADFEKVIDAEARRCAWNCGWCVARWKWSKVWTETIVEAVSAAMEVEGIELLFPCSGFDLGGGEFGFGDF